MDTFLGGGHILLTVLGFAFVIFIHELGHFAFAKWAGVRVEVFSIGFGPVIWSRSIGETRYALSLLPLGGYVRMLGQEDLPGRSIDEIHPQSYAAKHAGWRASILSAGVLFNLISSWLILLALALYGMPHFPPVVGEVQNHIVTLHEGERREVSSPALALGLERGDRILSVNQQTVRDFEDVIFATLQTGTNPIRLDIERDGRVLSLPKDPDLVVRPIYQADEGRVGLGIGFPRSRSIGAVEHFGDAADIDAGWRIEAINGNAVGDITGQELEQRLLPFVGQRISLDLQRSGRQRSQELRFAGSSVDVAGIFGLPLEVPEVLAGSPAEKAGIRRGDIITAINGQALEGQHDLRARVLAGHEEELSIALLRRENGSWSALQRSLRPQWDPVNQRPIIGIHMAALGSGRLPDSLPPALGGLPSPLLAAGIEAGSILLDARLQAAHSMQVRSLPGDTRTTLIPLSEEAWELMDRFQRVATITKLFGLRDRPALSQLLLGSRIRATGPDDDSPSWMSIETADGQREQSIDISHLPASDRRALLSLPSGAFIISATRFNTQDQRSLEIALPEEGVQPRSHSVQAAAVGSILLFGVDERPYELNHWGEAFSLASEKSLQMVGRTLALIPRFFQPGSAGGISAAQSLHGPIGIFSELQARLNHLGFPSFLRLLALIGLNLVIINLLPIPITDGGQLLILGIETAIRRPIPASILNIVNFLGLALIVLLMLFVIGNDIARQIFN